MSNLLESKIGVPKSLSTNDMKEKKSSTLSSNSNSGLKGKQKILSGLEDDLEVLDIGDDDQDRRRSLSIEDFGENDISKNCFFLEH